MTNKETARDKQKGVPGWLGGRKPGEGPLVVRRYSEGDDDDEQRHVSCDAGRMRGMYMGRLWQARWLCAVLRVRDGGGAFSADAGSVQGN